MKIKFLVTFSNNAYVTNKNNPNLQLQRPLVYVISKLHNQYLLSCYCVNDSNWYQRWPRSQKYKDGEI